MAGAKPETGGEVWAGSCGWSLNLSSPPWPLRGLSLPMKKRESSRLLAQEVGVELGGVAGVEGVLVGAQRVGVGHGEVGRQVKRQ